MRPIPAAAATFVKPFEGLRLTAYLCPANKWTIGYGSTRGVKDGMTITKAEANKRLMDDLSTAGRAIEAKVGADIVMSWTEPQYIAMLDFVFNLGTGDPDKPEWKIWGLLRAGRNAEIPGQLNRFVNANGRPYKQLIERRAAAAALWISHPAADEGEPDEHLPSSFTRSEPTPPTPTPTPGLGAVILTGGTAAVTSAAPMVSTAIQGVAPFAEHSDTVKHILGGLAVIGAVLVIATIVLMYLSKRAAKR